MRLTDCAVTWLIIAFFFFQAEDGIRDGHVTGVQTCALPISDGEEEALAAVLASQLGRGDEELQRSLSRALVALGEMIEPVRSEERRVGKECSGQGSAQPESDTLCACRQEILEHDRRGSISEN